MPTAVILDDEQTIKNIHYDKLHVRDGRSELGRGHQPGVHHHTFISHAPKRPTLIDYHEPDARRRRARGYRVHRRPRQAAAVPRGEEMPEEGGHELRA